VERVDPATAGKLDALKSLELARRAGVKRFHLGGIYPQNVMHRPKKPARRPLSLMNINPEAKMDTMERLEPRHFALPAAFVLTLLAFCFFGMNYRKPPILTAEPAKPIASKGKEIEIKEYVPPLIEPGDAGLMAKPLSGGGEPLPPTQIDVPRLQITGGFYVPIEPARRSTGDGDARIIPVYYGPGNGPGDRWGPTGDIVPAGLLDNPPRARLQVSPVYPGKEKIEGIIGTVQVEFIVDETGAVRNPQIVSSTNRAFEEPTLRAVERWRFVPGRRLGQVISFRMRVPVLFNLND
jgi:TonB family protein